MGEYQPFGPEWEKEMMKFPKAQLIEMLRKQLFVKSTCCENPRIGWNSKKTQWSCAWCGERGDRE